MPFFFSKTGFARFHLNPQFASKLRKLVLYWLLNSPNIFTKILVVMLSHLRRPTSLFT